MFVLHKVVVFLMLVPVYFYRGVISPMLSGSCRFYPSCSYYTLTSVKRFGVFRGYVMGVKRIVRCRPKNGGYDPVPYRYNGGAKWVI